MRWLILGGTRFVGRHIVESLLAHGQDVTLFHRGLTPSPRWDRPVRTLHGDRRQNLTALAGQRWDVMVDCCAYRPREVRLAAQALSGQVDRAVMISSISAYASFAVPNVESSPLGVLGDPDQEVVDGSSYGPLKAACEQATASCWGVGRSLILRPSLVVGPHDPTQRFTWWPARISRAASGEPVLAPGDPHDPIQCIDARDLAAFVVHAVEQGLSGAYNLASDPGASQRGELLALCAQVAATQPELFWATPEELAAQEVAAWRDMPLWLPTDDEHAAFMRVDNTKARRAGLQIRPLLETVLDTLAWWLGLPPDEQVFTLAGLSPERERAVLQALRTARALRGQAPSV